MQTHRKPFLLLLIATLAAVMILARTDSRALACGGFFCTNSPVDQNAERIIFTQNGDGTISAYVQIQYTGSTEDFSWILPMPSAIGPDDLEIPEDAMAAFNELETATNPVYIPPPFPDNCPIPEMAVAENAVPGEGGVEVFASGIVGPYNFDVIGSEDPTAMIFWLRDNHYMVTEEMEPLIDVYVREKMVFLAMRLLPDKEASDVEPVKITYKSDLPMIPLRLTAVAANPDMRVLVWFYADDQAVPTNYDEMQIRDRDIIFYTFGGNNYRQLLADTANSHKDGQAFVTEYAGPAAQLAVTHPLLQELGANYKYVTRLSTVLSPEEMTVDPTFAYDGSRPDVSNLHDLSNMKGVWDCEQDESGGFSIDLPFISTSDDPSTPQDESAAPARILTSLAVGGCFAVVLVVGVVLGVAISRRRRSQ